MAHDISYLFPRPVMDLSVEPDLIPPGSCAKLVGIDGRTTGNLRRFPGFKQIINNVQVGTHSATPEDQSIVPPLTFCKYVELLKEVGSSIVYRGWVVRSHSNTGAADTDELSFVYFDPEAASPNQWVSVDIAITNGAAPPGGTPADLDWQKEILTITTRGAFMYVGVDGQEPLVYFFDPEAAFAWTGLTMGPLDELPTAPSEDVEHIGNVGEFSTGFSPAEFRVAAGEGLALGRFTPGKTYGIAYRFWNEDRENFSGLSEELEAEIPAGDELRRVNIRIPISEADYNVWTHVEIFRTIARSNLAGELTGGVFYLDQRVLLRRGMRGLGDAFTFLSAGGAGFDLWKLRDPGANFLTGVADGITYRIPQVGDTLRIREAGGTELFRIHTIGAPGDATVALQLEVRPGDVTAFGAGSSLWDVFQVEKPWGATEGPDNTEGFGHYAGVFPDLGALRADFYDPRLEVTVPPPKTGRMVVFENMTLFTSEGASLGKGRLEFSWSATHRRDLEAVPAGAVYPPTLTGMDRIFSFLDMGSIVYGVGESGLYRFERAGPYLLINPVAPGYGSIGPFAATPFEVGAVIVGSDNVYLLNPATGRTDDLLSINRLVTESVHWEAEVRSGRIQVGYDEVGRALVFFNPVKQEAFVVFIRNRAVTSVTFLEDVNADFITAGRDPVNGGQNRVFFVRGHNTPTHPVARKFRLIVRTIDWSRTETYQTTGGLPADQRYGALDGTPSGPSAASVFIPMNGTVATVKLFEAKKITVTGQGSDLEDNGAVHGQFMYFKDSAGVITRRRIVDAINEGGIRRIVLDSSGPSVNDEYSLSPIPFEVIPWSVVSHVAQGNVGQMDLTWRRTVERLLADLKTATSAGSPVTSSDAMSVWQARVHRDPFIAPEASRNVELDTDPQVEQAYFDEGGIDGYNLYVGFRNIRSDTDIQLRSLAVEGTVRAGESIGQE